MGFIFIRRWLCAAASLILVALTAASAVALPRYAARYGQKCLLCHDDPSGGGKRSSYASQYLVPEELVIRRPDEAGIATIAPDLNDRISFGADLRTLYQYHPEPARKGADNFFQMQASLYLHVQLDERLALHVERGASGRGEAYGIAFLLPAGGYLRAGSFTPAFGWRLGDHTRFVRELTGFAPPGNDDVGIEAGFFPAGDGSLTLGLFNGAGGQARDGDNRFALALRGEWRHELSLLKLALGGSYYRDEEAGAGLERRLGGPFAYAALGPLAWLGEWDWICRERAAAEAITALVFSQELIWTLQPGLDLRATFDLNDPEIAVLTGSHRRLGLGADLLVTPFAGLQAMVNWHVFESGPAFNSEDYAETVLILHFLY